MDGRVAQGLPRRDQALFHGLLQYFRSVQAPAVVLNLYDDVAALVVGLKAHHPLGRLAGGLAFGRGFEPVVQGVAHHVHQGVVEGIDHVAVNFGLGPHGFQPDVFFELVGQIAHQAVHFLEGGGDGDHAQAHGVALEGRGDAGDLGQVLAEFLLPE